MIYLFDIIILQLLSGIMQLVYNLPLCIIINNYNYIFVFYFISKRSAAQSTEEQIYIIQKCTFLKKYKYL